jgi:hypothetical protein
LLIEVFCSQDTAKVGEVELETEECETAIPKLEEDIHNFNIKLSQEEKKLDVIRESSKGKHIPQLRHNGLHRFQFGRMRSSYETAWL